MDEMKEKQIEEMAKAICFATQKTNYSCNKICEKRGCCAYCKVMAEFLYAENCRKQIEGEWILHTNFNGNLDHYECSVCHKTQGYLSNYCEDCGAKMKGDAE